MLLRRLAILVLGVLGAAVTAAAAAGGVDAQHNETWVRQRGGAN